MCLHARLQYEFIAIPLVHNFVHVFPECDTLLLHIKHNYQIWKGAGPGGGGIGRQPTLRQLGAQRSPRPTATALEGSGKWGEDF